MSAPLSFSVSQERPAVILYIDDEQPTLLARTAQLQTAGYRVFPALTPNLAVELYWCFQELQVRTSRSL